MRTLIFSLIVFNTSCSESVLPGGQVKATKNGDSWSSEAAALLEPAFGDSLISIIGKVYNNQGYLRETLGFSKVPPRVGEYAVFIGGAPYTYNGVGISYILFEGDGHVISEHHTLDTLYQNSFSVDAFEESSGILKVTFECRMIFINGQNDTTYNVFKNGSIHVTIEDY